MSEYRLTFGATLSMAGVIDPEEVTDDVFLGGIWWYFFLVLIKEKPSSSNLKWENATVYLKLKRALLV